MKVKYLVCPGRIRSRNDNDVHYISAAQLMHLYKVPPGECIVQQPGEYRADVRMDLIVLTPRYDGHYEHPLVQGHDGN